jgi:outer membrane protein
MIAIFLAVFAQTATPPASPLTVTAAVQLALAHNPDIEEARTAVELAREARSASRSVFRPVFEPRFAGAIGAGDVANQQLGAELSQRFITGTRVAASFNTISARNQLGTYYYGETTLALTQTVFGGRDPARRDIDAASQAVDLALARQEATEKRVAADVTAAIYAVRTEELVVAAAEKAIARYRELVAVSEAKFEIGKVSQLDVLRAQRLVRQAAARVDASRARADDARDTLRELTGGSLSGSFNVAVEEAPLDGDLEIDAAVAIALAGNKELQHLRARVREAERETAGTGRTALPRLDFTLALTRREAGATLESTIRPGRFHLVPFVQLSMPDRGMRSAQLSAASELARKRRDLRSAELRLETAVRRAVREISRLAADVADAAEEVVFAERQVDVARERFTHGLSNNLDVITAETELIDAETRRFSAGSALAVARLRLKAMAG